MDRNYLPPIFPWGQGEFIGICLAIIFVAMLFVHRRKRVLLFTMFLMAAWQGGAWVGYLMIDIGIFHLALFALLIWNLSEGKFSFKQWQPFIKPLTPWFLLIIWSIVAVSAAVEPDLARQGPARFLTDTLFFLVLISSVKTMDDFRFLIICIAVAIIGQAILALIQFKISGVTFGVIDDSRTHMWWRSRGTFRHPNNLGMTFLILLPIMLRGIIFALASKDKKLLNICGTAFLMGGVGIITTYNRGAWVSLGIGLFVMICLDLIGRGGKTKKYAKSLLMIGVVIAMLGAVKFGGFIFDRMFNSDQEQIVTGREELQAEGLRVAMTHPIIGVGHANEQFYAVETFVHNAYILIAAEVGFPGLLLFLWFLFEFLRMIIKGNRSKIEFVRNYSRGFVASFVGFVIASIPGPDFWITYGLQYYFFAGLAVLSILLRMEHLIKKQADKEKSMNRMAPLRDLNLKPQQIAANNGSNHFNNQYLNKITIQNKHHKE